MCKKYLTEGYHSTLQILVQTVLANEVTHFMQRIKCLSSTLGFYEPRICNVFKEQLSNLV